MNLTRFAIERPSLIIVLFGVLFLGDFVAYRGLGVEMMPDFSQPVITIRTMYPGAAPEEVANSVTRPVEDAIRALERVDFISSRSLANASIVSSTSSTAPTWTWPCRMPSVASTTSARTCPRACSHRDLGKLSPIAGLQGLFSAQRLFQVARALFAAVLTLFLLRARLRDHLGDFAATLGSPAKAAVVAGVLCKALLRHVALLLCALALADVLFTRRAYFAKLRMSKDEVKREHKESEGDPHLKHAREQAHHEMMSQASMSAVRSATVVVVNPTHVAAALRYRDGEDDAPEIVAKGEGAHAQLIIETARAAGVPVVRDIPLARALVELEEGETIPEALYEATAEVLRTIAETDEGLTLVRGPPHGHADTSPTVWEMPAESV